MKRLLLLACLLAATALAQPRKVGDGARKVGVAASGAITLTSQGAAVTPLTIVPHASQTAPLILFSTDTGLARESAGLVKVTDGGAGSGGIDFSKFRANWNSSGGMNFNYLNSGALRMGSDVDLRWTSGAESAPPDVGIYRTSAGIVGITGGTGIASPTLGSVVAGNYTATALGTPAITAPLTVNGTPGATTYGYKAVAFLNDGTSSAASAEVTIATGPATLNATDNITVATPAVANMAYYNLYRTTGGAAPPKLIYSGTTPSYIDTGTEISASTPPATNTTGRVLVADGSAAAPSVAVASTPSAGMFLAATNRLGLAASDGVVFNTYAIMRGDQQFGWMAAASLDQSIDTSLRRAAAATLQLGAAPNATPVANTLIVGESSRAGTDTDVPGANGVIEPGAGTGQGLGSSITIKAPTPRATSDSTAQTYATVATFKDSGTGGTSVPQAIFAAGTAANPSVAVGPNGTTGMSELGGYQLSLTAAGYQRILADGSGVTISGDLNPEANDTRMLGSGGGGLLWKSLGLTRATLGSKSTALTDATATAFATFTIADGADYAGEIIYKVRALKGTNLQTLAGRARFTATREGSSYAVSVVSVGTEAVSALTGTLIPTAGATPGISISATGGVVTLKADYDTSFASPDSFTISWRFDSTDAALAITPVP